MMSMAARSSVGAVASPWKMGRGGGGESDGVEGVGEGEHVLGREAEGGGGVSARVGAVEVEMDCAFGGGPHVGGGCSGVTVAAVDVAGLWIAEFEVCGGGEGHGVGFFQGGGGGGGSLGRVVRLRWWRWRRQKARVLILAMRYSTS